jgi:hypothetical protein
MDGEALDVLRTSVTDKMRTALRLYFRELDEKKNPSIWHYDTTPPQGKSVDQIPAEIDDNLRSQWEKP